MCECLLCAVKAYWEAEHAAAQKEQEKRQQAVLKRWTKLIQGLRIRQRMREQYGSSAGAHRNKTPSGSDIKSSTSTAKDNDEDKGETQPATVGGFLSGVEDVVQPYSLPQPLHAVFSSPPPSPNPSERASPISLTAPPVPASPTTRGNPLPSDDGGEDGVQAPHPFLSDEDPDLDTDNPDAAGGNQHVRRMMPKSMAALAAEAAQAQAAANVATPQMSEVEASSGSAPLRATRSMPKRKTETKPRTPEETSRKKRARVRNDDDDMSRGSGSDPDPDEGRSTVTKRPRQQRQRRRLRGDADPSADETDLVPRSDRVLRTRKGKSPEQLAREHQQELAVKRALAGG
jgi:xeroderma pigmentosum group C-complementing protein